MTRDALRIPRLEGSHFVSRQQSKGLKSLLLSYRTKEKAIQAIIVQLDTNKASIIDPQMASLQTRLASFLAF